MKEDRAPSDGDAFLTLKGLGPGISFEFVGIKEGTGTYAGNWLKVVRHAPGRPDITFWLRSPRTPGREPRHVAGDRARRRRARKGCPTEDYILKVGLAQSQPRAFRYPRVIGAAHDRPGSREPLWAGLTDIR